MARAALLDTKTQTLLELIGNGKRYVVPAYQRDYSWGAEQWEDLWNDVLELQGKPEDKHYMGALVVEAMSDLEFRIIDGQQRLATLSILALVIVDHLQGLGRNGVDGDANSERAKGLRSRFIGEKDPASLVEVSKLSLNETNNGFFQDNLVQLRPPVNPRGLTQSDKLLWDCFQWFKAKVTKLQIASDGQALATLLNGSTARQLLFIQITVDDELNAYTVFETLNARGLELTVTDLLKNYLFSRVKVATDLDALQRRWRALLGVVRPEGFPDFLRYHLSCELPKVRSARLFKLVRERVGDAQNVFALMDVLQQRSEIFAALNDSNHEFWVERAECKCPVSELNLFRAKQMMPLLMTAWEKFSREEFEKLLRLLSTITFRYSVVSKLNANELEPVYHGAAKAVADGQMTSARDVFQSLASIYVDDEAFLQSFSRLDIETTGQRKQLVKYILCKLESDVSGVERAYETDPGTIEHILPENAPYAWESSFPVETWSKNVYRLGNLTLLEASLNRAIGNAPYSQKALEYTRSRYVLTQAVAELAPQDWTPETLHERQLRLASRALHVWRAAYA